MDTFDEDLIDGGTMEFEEGDLVEVEVGDETPLDDDNDEDFMEDDDKEDENDMDEEEGEENEFTASVVDQSVASFSLHGDCVYVSAIHPTKPGVVLTGGGDDRAMLWTYQTSGGNGDSEDQGDEAAKGGRNITQCIELSGHTDTVTSVGFNFDGTLALTGSYDGIVKIWKTETGELVQSLEGPEDVEWAEWHSKGNAVVAGSKDGTIWMWLAHNGQCVQVFAGHDGEVTCGLFTSDGKTIVSGGEDGSVRLWAPKTGQCKHVFSCMGGGAMDGHENIVTAIATNVEGDLVASGGMDGQVRLYLVPKKKVLQKFTHSLPTKSTDANMPPPPPSDTGDKDFDPSDDTQQEEELNVLGVECVGISNSHWKYVASGGMDKTMKIWDISTGTCRCVCEHPDSVVALKWHATLPIVVTACLDRVVRIWDARSGACVQEFTGHRDIITNLDFRQQPVPVVTESSAGESVTTTAVGDVIVTVSDDGTAKVFQANLQALLV